MREWVYELLVEVLVVVVAFAVLMLGFHLLSDASYSPAFPHGVAEAAVGSLFVASGAACMAIGAATVVMTLFDAFEMWIDSQID